MQLYVFFIFCFYTFLFDFGKHVNYCEKILFSLLYLTPVTSCVIGSFLCCQLLYLIIYLATTNLTIILISPISYLRQKISSLISEDYRWASFLWTNDERWVRSEKNELWTNNLKWKNYCFLKTKKTKSYP